MEYVAYVLVLSGSSLLLWWNRPRQQQTGAAAAVFASALLMAISAGLSLLDSILALPTEVQQTQQILLQAAVYAGLPLLAATRLAAALKLHWDKTIWGRILLALCAVFALLRQSDLLESWLLLTFASALAAELWLVSQHQRYFLLAPAAAWALLLANQQLDTFQNQWLAALVLAVVAMMLAQIKQETDQ